MKNLKDQKTIEKSKELIKEQIEKTKKVDLGLDADSSSDYNYQSKSMFDGFIYEADLSPLDYK